jgi:hypothetical protein
MSYTEFVDVAPSLGQIDSAEEYERECQVLDDCYTDVCKGTPYTILARPGREGEASATYAETPNGMQILGFSVPVPEEVADLQREAWDRYCALER